MEQLADAQLCGMNDDKDMHTNGASYRFVVFAPVLECRTYSLGQTSRSGQFVLLDMPPRRVTLTHGRDERRSGASSFALQFFVVGANTTQNRCGGKHGARFRSANVISNGTGQLPS